VIEMLTLPLEVSAQHADLIALIDTLVAKHGSDRSALIPVLQGLRAEYRDISDIGMQVVADRLGVPAVEVEGVATFYSFLGKGKTGRCVIRLCRTLSCQMAGMQRVADQLEVELGVPFGATTPDGAVTLEWANCIGQCDAAPAALVGMEAVGSLSPERVTEIVAGLR
jgi:NADH:ubiquinone oxidoreductase subunit E